MLPLVMVLVGRVIYGERLSPAHRWATGLAAAGVGFELLRAGGVSGGAAQSTRGSPGPPARSAAVCAPNNWRATGWIWP